MKATLSQVAELNGCMCRATGESNSEWLYDVTWLAWSTDGSVALDVPLVLESEWKRSGIGYDFDKLLLARAQLRVMVFETVNRGQSETITSGLLRRIAAFAPSRPGDRYLFAAWENGANFYFRPYTVPDVSSAN